MKILHLLKSAPDNTVINIIEAQTAENEVKVLNLSKDNFTYESLLEDIFSYDKVVSW